MEDYKSLVKINAAPDKVFNALTLQIPLWWTEMFEGSANEKNSVFTVRFGASVFKTIRVKEIVPGTQVSWFVIDSMIKIPELRKHGEWIGTTIAWEVIPKDDGTHLQLLHSGLTPQVECYNLCTQGWQQFTGSLKLFAETGKGLPFKAT